MHKGPLPTLGNAVFYHQKFVTAELRLKTFIRCNAQNEYSKHELRVAAFPSGSPLSLLSTESDELDPHSKFINQLTATLSITCGTASPEWGNALFLICLHRRHKKNLTGVSSSDPL